MSLGIEDKLEEDEVTILGNVLEFAGKTVHDVMVSMDDAALSCRVTKATDSDGGRVHPKRREDSCGYSADNALGLMTNFQDEEVVKEVCPVDRRCAGY